jgi:hypothetical protein
MITDSCKCELYQKKKIKEKERERQKKKISALICGRGLNIHTKRGLR